MPKKGYKQTEEHRAKLSEINKNRPPMSEETKEKIGKAQEGRKHTEETKRKMSKSQKGKIISEETRAKISEAKKGKKQLPEVVEKIASKLRGRKRSPETIAKIVAKTTGKKRTPEFCARISELQKGKKISDEARKHMSEGQRKRAPPTEETRRKKSEAQRGEKGSNWKGGISYEPYCILFNNEFKERVRNFFNCVCVECGKTKEENSNRKMHVHHVNFNKNTCCDNSKPLFVTLCSVCHAKTNHNREYWEERYTNLINEKYGGKCYLPKPAQEVQEVVTS